MIEYDKQFLYADWDSVLEGKDILLADSISDLKDLLKAFTDELLTVTSHNADNVNMPFNYAKTGTSFRYCYYDPNIECKKAFEEGKQIQARIPGTNDWHDSTSPHWENTMEYRVKPENSNPQKWFGKTVKVEGFTGIVTGYNPNADCYFVAGTWCTEEFMEDVGVD